MVPMKAKKSINGNEENLSSMSRFLKLLIRIKFIPIQKWGEKKATFKLFSFTTLIYIIVNWVIPSIVQCFNQLSLFPEITEAWAEMTANANIIDKISMVGFNIISLATWPLCPLLLAKALPQPHT